MVWLAGQRRSTQLQRAVASSISMRSEQHGELVLTENMLVVLCQALLLHDPTLLRLEQGQMPQAGSGVRP
jgi:hypothetical protein